MLPEPSEVKVEKLKYLKLAISPFGNGGAKMFPWISCPVRSASERSSASQPNPRRRTDR